LDCFINYPKLARIFYLHQVQETRLVHCLLSIVGLVAAKLLDQSRRW